MKEKRRRKRKRFHSKRSSVCSSSTKQPPGGWCYHNAFLVYIKRCKIIKDDDDDDDSYVSNDDEKRIVCDLSRTVVQRARHCRRANPDERANARERPKHLRRELCRRGRCHFDFVFSSLPFNSPLIIKGRAASFSLSLKCFVTRDY